MRLPNNKHNERDVSNVVVTVEARQKRAAQAKAANSHEVDLQGEAAGAE